MLVVPKQIVCLHIRRIDVDTLLCLTNWSGLISSFWNFKTFFSTKTPYGHRVRSHRDNLLIMHFWTANQNARKISTSLFHPSLFPWFEKKIKREILRRVSHLTARQPPNAKNHKSLICALPKFLWFPISDIPIFFQSAKRDLFQV